MSGSQFFAKANPEGDVDGDISVSVAAEGFVIGETSTTDPFHTLGRVQIGVDQVQGGKYYPFVCPSDDLAVLIGDLALFYKDPGCVFAPPFKIAWLFGFGDGYSPLGSAAEIPVANTHRYDMLITDYNDQVVFDSRDAENFRRQDWGDGEGDYLRLIEWVDADGQLLRIVIYTAWREDDSDITTWPVYFEPENSELDPRSYSRIPQQVEEFRIVVDSLDPAQDVIVPVGGNVVFRGGYNVVLTVDDPALSEGSSWVRGIRVDVIPGAGEGKVPCEADSYVRRINNVTADSRGNVTLDAEGCYRIDRPIESSAISGGDYFVRLAGPIEDETLDELSGLVYSSQNPQSLFIREDSGSGEVVVLISDLGVVLKTWNLVEEEAPYDPVSMVDAEDLAIGPGPQEGTNYLYIADIGDNTVDRDGVTRPVPAIHRFIEPILATSPDDLVRDGFMEITYDDASQHDAETFIVDPISGDGFIFTKEKIGVGDQGTTRVFRLPAEEMNADPVGGVISVTAQLLGQMDLGINYVGITAGDISFDGRRIVIRDGGDNQVLSNTNYDQSAWLWYREDSQTVWEAVQGAPVNVPLPDRADEPKGEAITFIRSTDYWYYTTSEIGLGLTHANLFVAKIINTIREVEVVDYTLAISNDCGPCCDCQDFINVYEAIRVLNDVFIELGFRAEIVRDQYRMNKSRWETGVACRADSSHLAVAMQPVANNRVAVSAALCNHSGQAMNNVKLGLTFQGSAGNLTAASTSAGTIVPGTTLLEGTGLTPQQALLYNLQGTWPEFSAHLSCVKPGKRGQVSFVMEFSGADAQDLVDVVVSAHGDDYGNAKPVQANAGVIPP